MRTSAIDIKAVLSTSLTDPQIEAFAGDASLWVTEELDIAAYSISDDRLKAIEKYLACALIRLRDLGLKSTSLNDVSESYQVNSEVTDYLHRAAALDPTGKVRKAFLSTAERMPVKFRIGQTYQEEAGVVE